MAIFGADSGLAQGDNLFLEDKIIMYISVLLSFLGLIFLVLVIISGVRWMTSGGEKDTIDKAKAMLKSSVIGLLIILASWVIANGVIELVVKQELLGDSYNKDRPLYPNGP